MGNCVVTGPNEALIISGGLCGSKKQVIARGGCGWAWCMCSAVDRIGLNVITLQPSCNDVETKQGVALTVNGVAQVAIMVDEKLSEGETPMALADGSGTIGEGPLRRAIEQFTGKSKRDIEDSILKTLEGHLRAILGTLTVEEVYSMREVFANNVMNTASPDLKKMGLEILSFTIKDVTDKSTYLDSLGLTRIEEVKRDATIGRAQASRDADVKVAEFKRMEQEAKYEAETVNANNKRSYETAKAGFDQEVFQKKAESDLAYKLQDAKMKQAIRKEEIEIEVVQRRRQIEVEEQEVLRKEKELIGTVHRPAEAEQYKRETLAEATKTVTVNKAVGEAEGIKLIGTANAARTLAIGEAEAEGMRVKAGAYQAYGDAAIVQMIVDSMPKIAAEVAAPLERTGEVVLLSGTGGGMSAEVAKLVSTLPPVVGALSGIDLKAAMQSMA